MQIQLLTVGKQKEPHLLAAQKVYRDRLTPFCRLEITQLPAERLPDKPSEKEILRALDREAEAVRRAAKGTMAVLCIEGRQMSSEDFSRLLHRDLGGSMTFVIGSSFGLSERLKQEAALRLSMSAMTFPHALASVMLLEQLYRAFQIEKGTGYHK